MKAKDLAKLLLKHPDFEVKTIVVEGSDLEDYLEYVSYDIVGIADIGYSDKVIILDCDNGEILED